MRLLTALAIGVAAIALPATALPTAAVAQANVDAQFQAFGDRIVDEALKLNPVYATQLGEHRYDAMLPDVSAAGRAASRAFAERSLAGAGGASRPRTGPSSSNSSTIEMSITGGSNAGGGSISIRPFMRGSSGVGVSAGAAGGAMSGASQAAVWISRPMRAPRPSIATLKLCTISGVSSAPARRISASLPRWTSMLAARSATR